MESFTDRTITDTDYIKNELKEIKKQGFSIDDEEIELGLKCIAAPIFDHQGNVIASISCASPKMRLDEERLPQVISGIKRAASDISISLGFKDDHHLLNK